MKNFSISKLADTILAQRKRMSLTQQELADKAGINRSMLCRLENQEYVPSLDQLTRLANTLQFDVADVFIEYIKPVFKQITSRNITVFGAGYVGLSIATMLARHHNVTVVDIVPEKVDKINQHVSPIRDEYIEKYFSRTDLHLTATLDAESACKKADFIIIAVSTGYDSHRGIINTSAVENVIETCLQANPDSTIVIRSNVPVGYSLSVCSRFDTKRILFSPEFLRESKAMYDNLYPSRIIIGCVESMRDQANVFADILRDAALKKDIEIRLTGLSEAETIVLFSNIFLAIRVAFFNELDTYTDLKNLNTQDIIDGICLDQRIGSLFNNPSFGFSGFGLPESPRQLFSSQDLIPHYLLTSVVKSNQSRKDYITDRVLEIAGISSADDFWEDTMEKKIVIGVFRLTAENDSVSLRHSPISEIIRRIKASGINVVIYEPLLNDGISFFGSKVINDLKKFKKQSNIIIANRYDTCLDNVKSKVYTRDMLQPN